jgi:hypothetical protein
MRRHVNVFFYGLFMDVDLLREKGFRPEEARPAHVDGMALRIGARATLAPDRDGRVYGTLAALTHDELDRLYAEPSVADYRPDPVLAVLADGSTTPALCYNLPAFPDGVASNADYAAKLREVAGRLGLPPDYVDRIR